jgi:hypothetical protein
MKHVQDGKIDFANARALGLVCCKGNKQRENAQIIREWIGKTRVRTRFYLVRNISTGFTCHKKNNTGKTCKDTGAEAVPRLNRRRCTHRPYMAAVSTRLCLISTSAKKPTIFPKKSKIFPKNFGDGAEKNSKKQKK